MTVRNKIYQSEYPYHIYNRTNNKEYLFNSATSFGIFVDCLKFSAERTDFRPHHFILMHNHFHMIGSTPKANLYDFMQNFQKTFSQAINKNNNRINHIFGGRYGATVITSTLYQAQVIRYLYQNPVRAKIVDKSIQYDFSTLSLYLNDQWEKSGLSFDPYLASFEKTKRVAVLKELCGVNLQVRENETLKKKLRKKLLAG